MLKQLITGFLGPNIFHTLLINLSIFSTGAILGYLLKK